MNILLAGYNLDYDLIRKLKEKSGLQQDLTPETISAAYARISRNPKPVNELRELARDEVEKARSSNRNIVFEMGHSSVAEHAVFNIDVIGVSRLLVEEPLTCLPVFLPSAATTSFFWWLRVWAACFMVWTSTSSAAHCHICKTLRG